MWPGLICLSMAVWRRSEAHAPQPLVAYGDLVHLEGTEAEGLVILEFPDMDSAQAWYHSPAYLAAAAFRHAGSKSQAFFVQGA
jgi:uncharacterized protein (DUF1330 family)